MDPSANPRDDLYRYVNGGWLDRTEIPADRARWGAFDQLAEESLAALRAIIEEAASTEAPAGSEQRKIGDLYRSFMDEAALESLGIRPLAEELAEIDALSDKKQIPGLIARLAQTGVSTPFVPFVHQDNKDSTKYVVDLYQYGLGLPDRDYYLKDDDERLKEIRGKYREHVASMLKLAGHADPAGAADAILALETKLAEVQWTKVENRDAEKTYNKVDIAALDELAPGFDWQSWLKEAGVAGKVDYLIVSQPSYITGFARILDETPLSTWKEYFRWHLISDHAPYLPKAFVDENFAFYGTVLRGVPENRPRWKRGVETVEFALGEALGKLYVERHFPPENKARMEALVGNLLKAYEESIRTLDWMGPETKKQALAKLRSFTCKIGYPNRWRDYSSLEIRPDDLVGNLQRAQQFEYRRNIDKLGKPIDRDEWYMTPQTVNAYYNPEMNEIVFPAAILQPPFFNVEADDAVNYGGIGAVIGHEISHGFDDQGSKYDGAGNLHDWWTEQDHEGFRARTGMLVEQYGEYEPVPGYKVNGELTLGENIADVSGLAIAYKAYLISLGGRPAPVIDGFTGEQRLFMGWAQVWRAKSRENEVIRRIKIDPHSPPEVRANATLKNQPGLYSAFGIRAGDGMYLPPEKRVTIW
jgi:predicted metalloendopeptidase